MRQFSKHKLFVSLFAGLICSVFSPYSLFTVVGEIKLHFIWAPIFPIMVAMAYGWRFGLVAGMAGGAWFSFLIWSNNGYANVINAVVELSVYTLAGFIRPDKFNNKLGVVVWRIIKALVIYTCIIIIAYYFLFPLLLRLNPPFWAPHAVTQMDQYVIRFLIIKGIISYSFLFFLSELLLQLPFVRKLLRLPQRTNSHLNHQIFFGTFSVGLFFWAVFVIIDTTLFAIQDALEVRYYTLVLILTLISSVAVSRNLITLFEKRIYAELKLKASEERLQTMITNISDVITIIDPSGINKFKSPNIERLFGWKPNELIGKHYLDIIHPDDKEQVLSAFDGIITGTVPSISIECRYQAKTGDYKWIEVNASNCIEISDIEGVVTTYRDISQRKVNQVLMQEIELARKESEFKKKFLANMSHEIRTPLTGIIGITELLAATDLNQTQRDYVATLFQSGDNLREIINMILDFSKIEAGELKVNPINFSLEQIIEDSESFFRSLCKKPIVWYEEKDSRLPDWLVADKRRIGQVLRNLISNAVKYTQQGEIKLVVRLGKVTSDHHENSNKSIWINFEVSDTGSGIEMNQQEKIFDPFFQVDSEYTRNTDGTGLGLAISKELVQLMDGKMGFASVHGRGSRFWFEIPVEIGNPENRMDSDNKLSQTMPSSSLDILLVEDKAVNRKVISLILQSFGHKVTFATNGMEAVEIFQPGRFHLILMDIQMPVMDGIEATRQLRQKYVQLPPIIGLSANAFEGDKEKYMAQGLDNYITKPVNSKELFELISKIRI